MNYNLVFLKKNIPNLLNFWKFNDDAWYTYGTGKYHCVSLDYIHGSKRVKNVSRNMWMLPNEQHEDKAAAGQEY